MLIKKLWTKSVLALLLIMGLNTAAMAHRDEGQFQILQARYGSAERNVDVTQRLKELAATDRNFRMGNDSFGIDPHPGVVKVLRIYARDERGENRTFEYREGSVIDGALFKAWGGGDWGHANSYKGDWGQVHEKDVFHKREEREQARDEGEFYILQALYGTAERNVDVTQRLKELAAADRNFRMGNGSFGVDPHPNHVKTLRIYARDDNGQARTFEYSEGSVIDGARFKAWGGKEWKHSGSYKGGWGGNLNGNNDNRDSRDRYNTDQQRQVSQLSIVSAQYGANNQRVDVTQFLQSRVRGGRLEMKVENAAFGEMDPAPGIAKILWVNYSVNGGPVQQVRVDERGWVNLPR
jgi:hypothetical protein